MVQPSTSILMVVPREQPLMLHSYGPFCSLSAVAPKASRTNWRCLAHSRTVSTSNSEHIRNSRALGWFQARVFCFAYFPYFYNAAALPVGLALSVKPIS